MDDLRTTLALRLVRRGENLAHAEPRRAAEALEDAAELLRLVEQRRRLRAEPAPGAAEGR